MHTFDPERTITRAHKVLPASGWFALDERQRRFVLRAAWVVTEADGAASSDEKTALAQLAGFLSLDPSTVAVTGGGAAHDALIRDLREAPRDRSFARHLHAALYLVGMSDGVLVDAERRALDEVARAVGLDGPSAAMIEAELHGVLYEEIVAAVYKDGIVSARERPILRATQRLLGLSDDTAARIEDSFRERFVRGDMGAY